MNPNSLISFFERDLKKLIAELEQYKNEANIWLVANEISNSAGNLALHLVGNLHTYIGRDIGKTNYIRQRDLEFSQKNVPRQELIKQINETIEMIKTSINSLSTNDLAEDYPFLKFAEPKTIEYLLVHLASHLAYHLGQVNYHRRLLGE